MDAIDELVKNIKRNADSARQAQIRFVECESVDWDAKTMTASGTDDGVQYFDILLGLGNVFVKPRVESVCLIGIIDGSEVASFLIDAEQVEIVELRADEMIANDGVHGGLVKVKELVDRLNLVERDLNAVKTAFTSWVVSPNDGGGALKAATSGWAAQQLSVTARGQIENEKIKH